MLISAFDNTIRMADSCPFSGILIFPFPFLYLL